MSESPEGRLQLQLAQAQSPLLLALFDTNDRLHHCNAAFSRAWGLPEPTGAPRWLELAQRALAAGLGPRTTADELLRAQTLRGRMAEHSFEQEWADGRWIWWVQTRTTTGWLWCVGTDISALARPGCRQGVAFEGLTVEAPHQAHDRVAGRRMLQAALADARAWPLAVAVLRAGSSQAKAALAEAALACIRREDACAHDENDDLLLLLPMAGPAQAQAVLARLLDRCDGAAGLTQARWGEPAEATLARLRALCAEAGSSPGRLAQG